MDQIKPSGFGLPSGTALPGAPRVCAGKPRVEPVERAEATRAQLLALPGQARATAEARDIAALRREMERRGLQPGPPPAFELSLLEIDRDVLIVIARMDAHRIRDALAAATGQPDTARAARAAQQDTAAQG